METIKQGFFNNITISPYNKHGVIKIDNTISNTFIEPDSIQLLIAELSKFIPASDVKVSEQNKALNISDISGNELVCRIELTLEEAKAIAHSLGRTMCKGNELTISMKLEDKLVDIIKHYR